MKLGLAFWALDDDDARRQANDWIAAERNVETGTVLSIQRGNRPTIPGLHDRYTVFVELVFRQKEPTLWDAA